MSRIISIIGAGIYGCYIASRLLRYNVQNIRIIDKENGVMRKSSSYNQYRLHTGFHYPRSIETRVESLNGYNQFYEELQSFIIPTISYYMVHPESQTSLEKVCEIARQEMIPFELVYSTSIQSDLYPFIQTSESIVDVEGLQALFTLQLSSYFVEYSPEIIQDALKNDIVIDCTYGALFPHDDFYEEHCIMFVYCSDKILSGLTVIDGPFYSLFPFYSNGVQKYTLSHVTWTPKVYEESFDTIRQKMEESLQQNFPDIMNGLIYESYFISRKCKRKNNQQFDDRSLFTYHPIPNVLSMIGGKMTGIFPAFQKSLQFIRENQGSV